MKQFLQLVAEDLRRRIGTDFSHTLVIFPNKRACRFLNEHLHPREGKPIWAPRYMAINEFIRSLSPLLLADNIESVCRIFRHYVRLTHSTDDLDTFYGWGERILADFDDLDKSMAPADEVFQNLKDYQAIGDTDEVLTEEQRQQFQRFISGFTEKEQTEVKSRYLHLWNHLHDIYTALRAELSANGMAYEGQLYRDVAERLRNGESLLPATYDHVVFVGLNVINEVERTVFQSLLKQGKALFYWDYDTSYTTATPHGIIGAEAGIFIQKNLKEFPSALTDEEACYHNFLTHRPQRTLHYVDAPTESAQAQDVNRWLSQAQNFDPREARETAIVLCNEALLQPVLRALPSAVTDVNITMGFPLSHTPAYALFVNKGNELLNQIAMEPLLEALKNPTDEANATLIAEQLKAFLTQMQDIVTTEAAQQHERVAERDANLDILFTESYFQTFTLLSRFIRLVEERLLMVRPFTLFKLVRQTLSNLSVPFHGEPVKGLQIMGVLETRCLDFKRVLMLSVGEGFLPQKATDTSFIPYLIRQHFGMTTSEHKTSVYAYYFHRLLQRADHVTLEYNSSTEGLRKGEMSRFMNALLIEDAVRTSIEERLNIRRFSLTSKPLPTPLAPTSAPKPADMADIMKKVSPSKINTYLRCQMLFYYKYVLRLQEKRPKDAIISATDFGTVLHKAAELLYRSKITTTDAQPATPERLTHFLENGKNIALEELIKQAIAEVNKEREECTYRQEDPIVENDIATQALIGYLKQLLHFEAGLNTGVDAPASSFVVKGMEADKFIDLPVTYGPDDSLSTTVRLEGNIDRIDHAKIDNTTHLRIVDYKTGGKMEEVKNMDALFTPGPNHPHYALQTFLYALTVLNDPTLRHEGTALPIAPALFYLKQTMKEDYTPYIKFEGGLLYDFREIADEFRKRFTQLLAEMLNPATPFTATPVANHCRSCVFASLCGK